MQFRRLGNSGLHVSVIGLGTNQFGGKVDEAGVKDLMDAALDGGMNLIDTADMYQDGRSEETIGKAIQGRRENFLIATKFYYARGEVGPNEKGGSRYHLMNAVEASLRRLDTDYIDLYQMHHWDESTPIEETLRALDDLITQGKVRYIGASNFSAWQLTHAKALSEMKAWNEFVSIQPHYHMFERGIEEELIPACNYFGWGILPYFPLAGGFLTGKYKAGQAAPKGSRGEQSPYVQKYMTDDNYAVLGQLTTFAEERDHTINELAHAWLLGQTAVSSVISGATSVEHVQANAKASEWELSTEEYEEVTKILDGEDE
ncbi:MAG: aldo/keto reductase [Chloroflexi bacterium]|nr:MAG: aldo/keto reductase [Chloroflexota bacterium]MBL1195675.1 aldo/keto reductase [Chloroflexota bacterium]NOH12963.1 aldo/keto reductase [Chloroflexota bacterium]